MEEYVSKFQRLVVMVLDVSDKRLMFFIEGLPDSFRGLVRALEPALEEAIRKALSLEDFTKKGKTIVKNTPTGPPKKPFIKANPPPKGPPKGPHGMSRSELRKKGLCYYCNEKWDKQHRCQGRGQVYYIEVISDDEAEVEEGINEEDTSGEYQELVVEGSPIGGMLATLLGAPRYHSLLVRGVLRGQKVMVLIDSGATHNFIDKRIVAKLHLVTEDFEGFDVLAARGHVLPCTKRIQQMELILGVHEMKDDFYVVNVGDIDMVLGVQWLHSLGEYTTNYQTMELKFKKDGKEVVLKGLSMNGPMVVSTKRMGRSFHRDQVAWAAKRLITNTSPPKEERTFPSDFQALLNKKVQGVSGDSSKVATR
jgi:hypothetical protein